MNPIKHPRCFAAVLTSLSGQVAFVVTPALAMPVAIPGTELRPAPTLRRLTGRRADMSSASTAYVDLAMQLSQARGTDGRETVWFYQRLSTSCAQHGR
jgi:hypothetical protein